MVVSLAITDSSGVLHLVQVGGENLARLVKELASVDSNPMKVQDNQMDLVGQEIFYTRDHTFFGSLLAAFTHMSWCSAKSIPSFESREGVVYSFVVSY